MPYWDDGSGQSKSEYDAGGGLDQKGNRNDDSPKTSPKSPPTTKTLPPKKPKETKDNKVKSNFVESYFNYNPVARTVNKMSKSKFATNLNAKRRQKYLKNLKTEDIDAYNQIVGDLEKVNYVKRGVEEYGPPGKGAGRDIETFLDLDGDGVTDLGDEQALEILGPRYKNTLTFDNSGGGGGVGGGGGDNANILPYPINVQKPEEDVEPYNQFTYDENAFGPGGDSADVTRASYNFNQGGRAGKAEGGIMELRARRAFGGIMDRVTGRKAYGLGSIFKSVKKAASKVLKSPIGKAALLYAGGAYLGGSTMMGGAGGNFMSRMAPGQGNFARLFANKNNTGISQIFGGKGKFSKASFKVAVIEAGSDF